MRSKERKSTQKNKLKPYVSMQISFLINDAPLPRFETFNGRVYTIIICNKFLIYFLLSFMFINSLFNYDISSSDYVVSNDQLINE
jgi:hypothetical protein